jgi:hypothetical protein
VLRLRRYPAWRVTVNGRLTATPENREDGLMAIPVSAGPSIVEVRWDVTADEAWGRGISLCALLLFIALSIIELRARKDRA